LGKSTLEYYTSMKEGLGTCAPSYETACWRVNAIRNGQEETGDAPHGGAPALAMDERHMEQVNPYPGNVEYRVRS